MHKRETTWDGANRAANPYHSLLQAAGVISEDGEDGLPVQYTGVQGTMALAFAMANLTEREQTVLNQRFVQGMNYEESGKTFGVTRERIRQVEAKALRKLRRQNVMELLRIGIASYWEKCVNDRAEEIAQKVIDGYRWKVDQEYNKRIEEKYQEIESDPDALLHMEQSKLLQTPIDNLDLSVRSYNVLKRANIDTVEDLTKLTCEGLLRLRNMGRKSATEIEKKLHDMGLKLMELE